MSNAKFFRLASLDAATGVGKATLGPMPGSGKASVDVVFNGCYSPLFKPLSRFATLVNDSRGVSFPGMMRVEKPARGVIPCPDPQDVTLDSTITLDDGINAAVAFQFTNGGGPDPGNIEVDLTGLTTAAELATLFASVINTNRAGVTPTLHVAEVDGATVYLAQASDPKSTATVGPPGSPRGTWWGKAGNGVGDCESGNLPIVASVPLEWPGLVGMLGGRNRGPGVICTPAVGTRAVASMFYYGVGTPEV